jgi:hypothetical protein
MLTIMVIMVIMVIKVSFTLKVLTQLMEKHDGNIRSKW